MVSDTIKHIPTQTHVIIRALMHAQRSYQQEAVQESVCLRERRRKFLSFIGLKFQDYLQQTLAKETYSHRLWLCLHYFLFRHHKHSLMLSEERHKEKKRKEQEQKNERSIDNQSVSSCPSCEDWEEKMTFHPSNVRAADGWTTRKGMNKASKITFCMRSWTGSYIFHKTVITSHNFYFVNVLPCWTWDVQIFTLHKYIPTKPIWKCDLKDVDTKWRNGFISADKHIKPNCSNRSREGLGQGSSSLYSLDKKSSKILCPSLVVRTSGNHHSSL